MRLAFIGNFLIGDLLIVVVQAGFQDFHCFFAVFDLASFVLADNDHTRGKVRYADCGFRLIDVLTACAARAESVDFQVLVQNFDFDVGGFREHRNRDRRGMHATLRFGFRHALYAVNAAFVFKFTVNAFPGHHEHDFFYAAEFGHI